MKKKIKSLTKQLIVPLKLVSKQLELSLRNSSFYGIFPTKKCVVFFPGCSLPASSPLLVSEVFEFLKSKNSSIQMWSVCCGKPLSKFYSVESTASIRLGLVNQLQNVGGVEEIITACGNCSSELEFLKSTYPDVKITSLYEVLARYYWPKLSNETFEVHHPCPARVDRGLRKSFEDFAEKLGLDLNNPSKSHHLACCLYKSPSAQKKLSSLRENRVLTYCAHCVQSFQKRVKTEHVLSLVFNKEEVNKRDSFWKPVSIPLQFKAWRILKGLIDS